MEFAWYLPVLIFVARIADVSLGTVRMIFVINGWRWRAALVAFAEVLIWAAAVAGLVTNLTQPVVLMSYAAGYATGTLVGITIEQRLAFGIRMVRVINRDISHNVSAKLREAGFRVTRVEGTGRDGPVEVAFAVVPRKELARLLRQVEAVAPEAMLTVERADSAVGLAHSGLPPSTRPSLAGFLGVRK